MTDEPSPPPGTSFPRRVARARRSPRRTTAIVAGVALALAALGVVELALRRAPPSQPGLLVDDATCFYTAAPAGTSEMSKPGTPLHHRFEADARGFRIPVGSAAKRASLAAKCRVLCVGDSFTEGLWVDAEEAYPAVLERTLGERGYAVRVDNGGMRGHTIAQERIAALGRFREPAASIVIVGQSANDLEDLVDMESFGCKLGGPLPTALRPAIPPEAEGLGSRAQDVAAGVAVLGERLRAFMKRPGDAPGRTEARCAEATKAYAAEAAEIAGEVRKGGGKPLFASLEKTFCAGKPWQNAEGTAPFYEPAVREAGGAVEVIGVAFHDPGVTLEPHDGHPSPEGHRRIAMRLADRLAALGWLDACRASGDAR